MCALLTANPFNTAAAEAMLDVLLDCAPAADLALERVLKAVIDGTVSNGVAEILGPEGPATAARDCAAEDPTGFHVSA